MRVKVVWISTWKRATLSLGPVALPIKVRQRYSAHRSRGRRQCEELAGEGKGVVANEGRVSAALLGSGRAWNRQDRHVSDWVRKVIVNFIF